MTATGVVLSTDGERARVRVLRKSPCASCEGCAGGACHAELTLFEMPKDVTVCAANPVGAHTGDMVELYSDSRFTLGLAAGLFLIPLVAVFLVAIFSNALGGTTAAWLATVGVVLVFVLLALAADKLAVRHQRTVINKILKESGQRSRVEYAD